jgi:hypothetical protein
MNKLREFKLSYQYTCKRFIMPSSFKELVELTCTSFSLQRELLQFSYIDHEGDKIIISNDVDFNQMIKILDNNNSIDKSIMKIVVEKHSVSTLEAFHSPLTRSLEISEDEEKEAQIFDFNELKTKLKYIFQKELEDKLEEVKNKVVSALDSKISGLFNIYNSESNFSSTQNLNIGQKSVTSNKLKIKGRKIQKSNTDLSLIKDRRSESNFSSPEFEQLRTYFGNNPNLEQDTIQCKRCQKKISFKENSTIYNCFSCEDVYYCNPCEKELESIHKHIFLKIANPDTTHYDTYSKFKKITKSIMNKKKLIKQLPFENFPCISFNSFYGTKSIIEINMDVLNLNKQVTIDNTEKESDYTNISVNFVNFSKESIPSNSYLECAYEQSDVFGNKYIFPERIEPFEEFECCLLFYNFRTRQPGYYSSKWTFHNSERKENTSEFTFVFHIFKNTPIYSLQRDVSPPRTRKQTDPNKMHTLTHNKLGTGVKLPDMYSEIIKKHKQTENINKI